MFKCYVEVDLWQKLGLLACTGAKYTYMNLDRPQCLGWNNDQQRSSTHPSPLTGFDSALRSDVGPRNVCPNGRRSKSESALAKVRNDPKHGR
jgi:hypothetical protein